MNLLKLKEQLIEVNKQYVLNMNQQFLDKVKEIIEKREQMVRDVLVK